MLIGAHSIIYSTDPERDRAFLRDVIKMPNVDVHDGWLVFGLPPSEVAVHPSDKNGVQEFYLICDDVNEFVEEMRAHNVECSAIHDEGWGLITEIKLPSGSGLGVYQARHARPESMPAG